MRRCGALLCRRAAESRPFRTISRQVARLPAASRFKLLSAGKESDEYIRAGTRHRIIVPRGKLGLALERGEPVLYEPGSTHLVNSALFEYKRSVDITQQVIEHGSLKIVTVKDGFVRSGTNASL